MNITPKGYTMRKTNLNKLREQLNRILDNDQIKHFEINKAYDNKFEYMPFGPFGLCPSNPVQLQGNQRVKVYLNSLRHHSGASITFEFDSYQTAYNLNNQAEEYRVLDDFGDEICRVYICTGAVLDSEEVPDGFFVEHHSSLAA
jgi:hypothetical protein